MTNWETLQVLAVLVLLTILVMINLLGSFYNGMQRYQPSPESSASPEPVARNVSDIPVKAVSSEDMTCMVCWVNAKNIVFEPCGHVAACETCSLQLTNPECLICELPVTKTRRIFL